MCMCMKHTRNAILHDAQAAYLEGIEPARDALLAEMEAFAAKHDHPISDPEVGSFLATAVRASGSKRIIEVGTNIGYGAIVLARAGGPAARVLTIEKSRELCDVARGFIARDGLSGRVEVREGAAIAELEKLEGTWDLAYVDCVKDEYGRYLELLLPRLRLGGVIVADNVLWRGLVAHGDQPGGPPIPENERARVGVLRAFNRAINSAPLRGVILPLGDGVAYAVKG
jgi:predicted O-methyltransferase YrrM